MEKKLKLKKIVE